jgi:hypothetical protein
LLKQLLQENQLLHMHHHPEGRSLTEDSLVN